VTKYRIIRALSGIAGSVFMMCLLLWGANRALSRVGGLDTVARRAGVPPAIQQVLGIAPLPDIKFPTPKKVNLPIPLDGKCDYSFKRNRCEQGLYCSEAGQPLTKVGKGRMGIVGRCREVPTDESVGVSQDPPVEAAPSVDEEEVPVGAQGESE